MSEEQPASHLENADSDASVAPGESADAAASADSEPDERAAAPDPEAPTEQSPPDESQRREELQRRRMFAEAQEHFAAAEFVRAHKRLKEIPEASRTADVERLLRLAMDRIRAVADLRSEIETAVRRNHSTDLNVKLLRYLELQPGDEWANNLRHWLDETERVAPPTPPGPPLARGGNRTVDPPETSAPRRRHRETTEAVIRADATAGTGPPKPPVSRAVDVVIIEDDETDEDEAWAFGERLVRSGPPPLPGAGSAIAPEFDDDFDDYPDEAPSSAGVWIAFAVSGIVILLALIATIFVLAFEQKS